MNTIQPTTLMNQSESIIDNAWSAGQSSRSIAFIMLYMNLGLLFVYAFLSMPTPNFATYGGLLSVFVLSAAFTFLLTAYFVSSLIGLSQACIATLTSNPGEPRRFAACAVMAHCFLIGLPLLQYFLR